MALTAERTGWLERIESAEPIQRLAALVEDGGFVSAQGSIGSSTTIVAGVLARTLARNQARRTGAGQRPRTMLLVHAHLDDADEAVDELADLFAESPTGGAPLEAVRLPAMEALPGESSVAADLLAERLAATRRLLGPAPPAVLVAAMPALMQGVPRPDRLATVLRTIAVGDRLDVGDLAGWLEAGGYARRETVENPAEFAVRGGIVDLFPAGAETPVRLDLFGDEVERIFDVDLATMASDRRRDRVELVGATVEAILGDDDSVQVVELLPPGSIAVLAEVAEILEQGRGYYERVHDARSVVGPPRVMQAIAGRAHAVVDVNQFSAGANPDRRVALPVSPLPPFDEDVSAAVAELGELAARRGDVAILCERSAEAERMRELVREMIGEPRDAGAAGRRGRIAVEEHHLHRGFIFGDPGDAAHALVIVPQHELLHRYGARRRVRALGGGSSREAFLSLSPGDHVVHRDHGIARFVGLGMLPRADRAGESPRPRGGRRDGGADADEVLTLEFDGGTRLHVPMSRIDLVQRYVGAGNAAPTLSTIGGRRWRKAKEQAEEATRELAGEMLRVQAAREATAGIRFPDDTPWQREFEAEFPYTETDDQVAAIAATKRDMCSPRPMDRLVCGDVGFGKTEVAMRAAFKAVESGRQVAVLVPTTVLAEQHEQTFRERFRAYPFRVESLSRFKTAAEQNRTLRELAAGRVDVVIGTHRLLSADVAFADLGLVVVDEEQRFGVEHKNRLLQFRLTADVLTLSATPIPRTLHMAMLGLRDISSLTTPPLDRRAIVTEASPFNESRIRQALERELAREGQAFVVHNRVRSIQSFADDIRRLVPDARIIVGHGQMPGKELEDVMLRFMRRQADILVCTTIIESGIDIPTANTMVINNAHMFGLAELHQLRGRVGRSKHRGYCYLFTPADRTIGEDAMKRLRALEDHSMLGAGFRIAMRDLEIRGAGNLLGAEQSGHIAAVGYEMYCRLLEQAVGELRREPRPSHVEIAIEIGVRGSIPRGYIPSDQRRMEAHRRIADAVGREGLAQVRRDLVSAYGELPGSAEALFDLADLRVLAGEIGVRSIARTEQDVVFRTTRPGELEARMRGAQGTLRVVGAGPNAAAAADGATEVFYRPPAAFLEPMTLMAVLRKRLA